MNIKKLFFCTVISAVTVAAFCTGAFANNVGDPIEKVLSTDIVTYIDGIRVPSFNIKGRTAVIVENLNARGVGFAVNYDDSNRTLTVLSEDSSLSEKNEFFFDTDTSSEPVGTPIMDVLYTDIRTFFETTEMESFNIGGFTCIYADDLAKMCGTYIWSEEDRTVNIHTDRYTSSYPEIDATEAHRALEAKETVLTKSDIFNRWSSTPTSYLTRNDDGTFYAIEIDEHINIETYDKDFSYVSSFAIKKELPIFGSLYFGKNYNYIAFGQENLLEDSSREVIKIVIYDKKFVKISEVSVNNCKTAIPFDFSNGQMYENDRYLVLHTARSQYADEKENRPQTQLTVIVDKHTWQVCNMLGKFQHNHTSHALGQYVRIDQDRLITANYSDAAPLRGAFLQELDFSGKVLNTQGIFNVGGPSGANCTGAMIGGFEVSSSGYLVPISTIDHSLPDGYSNVNIDGIDHENRDIYLLWADKNTWELKHVCLAQYTGANLTGSVPYLINLGNDTFMVLWQQFTDTHDNSNEVCYAFVNGKGEQIGITLTVGGHLSQGCQPIVSDGKVIWYVNESGKRIFYSLNADPQTAIFPEEDTVQDENIPSEETDSDKDASTNEDPSLPDTDDKQSENSAGTEDSDEKVEDKADSSEKTQDENTSDNKKDENKKEPPIVDGI